MNTETNVKPLYKVLKAYLGDEEIITMKHLDKSWGLHKKQVEGEPVGSGEILGVIGHAGLSWNTTNSKALAQYTSLSVNNLHIIAEALENLINKMESSMLTADIQYYREEKNAAKEALQKIS